MTRIIGLAGSLRARSYNRALLRAAVAHAPEGSVIEAHGIDGIPLYDGDVEAGEGVPEAVARLKDEVAGADGLLLVTPEYNHSIPGAFKNAIDWMTRPPKDIARVFKGRPVGVIGATPGRGGTVRAQMAWLPVLQTLDTRPFFGAAFELARAGQAFDDELALEDEKATELLEKYLKGFVAFCREQGSRGLGPSNGQGDR